MSEATEAASFIKRQVALLRGYEQLADTLERIGSVELAAKEAQAAWTAAELERDVAQSELNNIKTQIAESKDAAAEILLMAGAKAKAEAEQVIAAAIAQAESKAASADAAARNLVATAQTQADAIKTEYLANQALSVGLQDAIGLQKEALATAQKEHDRINKAIESLKAKLA